ncbi:MAG: hypothetical protein IT558_05230 [Alphaproteobacteria bacterium]|nr:hypothetical protein [Alphaproteobacteria bacterium]
MKYIFQVFVLCTAVMTVSAGLPRAEVYIKRDSNGEIVKDNALPVLPEQQESPSAYSAPAPVPAPTQAPAAAADPEPDPIGKFASNYFENCMSKENNALKGELLKKLCACSATKIAQTMTVADVKSMAEDTPAGQEMRNRMLLEVYAPCIEYPTQALLLEKCMSDTKVQQQIPGYQQACTCMAASMGQYMAANGPAAIAQSIAANPGDTDPLASLMNSQGFQAEAQSRLAGCLTASLTGSAPQTPAGQ